MMLRCNEWCTPPHSNHEPVALLQPSGSRNVDAFNLSRFLQFRKISLRQFDILILHSLQALVSPCEDESQSYTADRCDQLKSNVQTECRSIVRTVLDAVSEGSPDAGAVPDL